MPVRRLLSLLAFLLLLGASAVARADKPLHQRIDDLIAKGLPNFAEVAAPLADDAEFLRRLYLDLTGTIPPTETVRAFLDDKNPDKRAKLIDQLLASEEHARYMATVFDVMLMERRTTQNVPSAAWRDFLRENFAANKPWDVLVREILAADGSDPKTRPAARFFLDRGGEPNLLTRDVGRLFLGVNLHCAQCHNHPRVEDYKQAHYYGIYAFLGRTSMVNDPATKMTVLSEKADGEATFQSVFDPKKVTMTGQPSLFGGKVVADPMIEKGKEYVVAPPAKGPGRAVPTYSRRSQLGPALATAENTAFKRNIANRLWAVMMGRGLVHPLDMDHSDNPPSHPELLDLLADEIAARKFDMRGFLKELALSKTYQRSSLPSPKGADIAPDRYVVAKLKPLLAEQLAFALMEATGFTDGQRQALGAKPAEAALYARLAPNATPFVNAFGSEPGTAENFDARVEQALFLANGPTLKAWLAPAGTNLTARLLKAPTPEALAEELYLSIYTRKPSAEETKVVTAFLAKRADKPQAMQDLAWALLASTEFRFNH
jgi:hypothetical protein